MRIGFVDEIFKWLCKRMAQWVSETRDIELGDVS